MGGRVDLDRRLQQIGLDLQQRARSGEPAVDAQARRRPPGPAGGLGQPRHLRGDALDGGADEVAPLGAEGQPVNAPRACGAQNGDASPASAGTNATPAGSADRAPEAIEVGRAVMIPTVAAT